MTRNTDNERGMALIIVLMVVSILTIIVTEFTFSAQVDYHMVHNGLSSLKASLLARSGINIGEALLLHDQDPTVDSFAEEWCPLAGPRGESCLIDETNSGIVIPENMRLRVQIFDEGAKFNINWTKPNLTEFQAYMTKKLAGSSNSDPTPFHLRVRLLGEVMQAFGLQLEAVDNLARHWEESSTQLCQQFGWSAACKPPVPLPGGGPVPPPGPAPLNAGYLVAPDFPSLDDVGIVTGFSPAVLRRSRSFVTAFARRGSNPQVGAQGSINLNTAPRRLLEILLQDAATVDSIISEREQGPSKQLPQLVHQAAAVWKNDPSNPRNKLSDLFNTATSQLFLIRASAIINPNPLTGKGGIGRTVSMLVRRDPKPGVGQNAPPGTARWMLTRIDWQKEGGAVLFREDLDQMDQEDLGR